MLVTNTQIELAAATTDETKRPYLQNPFYHAELHQLVATDGHILALMPVSDYENDCQGIVPVTAIKAARKAAKGAFNYRISAEKKTVLADKVRYERPGRMGGQSYPDVEKVYKNKKFSFVVSLDPELLLRLAKAITRISRGKEASPGDHSVVLEFQADPKNPNAIDSNGAIKVTPSFKESNCFGYIMPVRS